MVIGVLALQGGVAEHIRMLKSCSQESVEVRTVDDLLRVNALIIPGGESTTLGKLIQRNGLSKKIIEQAKRGMPIYGTCAGAILLSKKVEGNKQFKLNLIDIDIKRNDYGSQLNSFEEEIQIVNKKKPFKAIFIRAPVIKKVGNNVQVLAKRSSEVVFARQDNILVSTFHPELSNDLRIHKYFIEFGKH